MKEDAKIDGVRRTEPLIGQRLWVVTSAARGMEIEVDIGLCRIVSFMIYRYGSSPQ